MAKKNKLLKINFDMSIKDVVSINSSFAAATCCIAYTGENRNYSSISREAFENALPTLKNVPIVGNYDIDENMFGGHDIAIVEKDGKPKEINLTIPYGTIPESANQWFETVEVDGVLRECLFTDVIIWKRMFGYEHLLEVGTVGQSMEINVYDCWKADNGVLQIDKFEFTALCMLEKSEPCFEPAMIQLFSNDGIINDFKSQYSLMIDELKEIGANALDFNKIKGGIENLESKENKEVVEDVVLEEEQKESADQEIQEDVVVEEDIVDENSENEETTTDTELEISNERNQFALAYMGKCQKIQQYIDSLDKDVYDVETGVLTCYVYNYLMDFDDEYFYFKEYVDTYDQETKTWEHDVKTYRIKYSFDANEELQLDSEKVEMFVELLTLEEKERIELERSNFELIKNEKEELEKYKNDYPAEEFNRLKEFEANTLEKVRLQSENKIFSKYESKIGETNEFKKLVEDKANFTLENLEKECIYIVGLYAVEEIKDVIEDEEVETKAFSFEIDDVEEDDDEPYGGLLRKH